MLALALPQHLSLGNDSGLLLVERTGKLLMEIGE